MIKIPKKPSHNFKKYLFSAGRLLTYLIFPVYLLWHIHSFKIFFLFFCINLIISIYFIRRTFLAKDALGLKLQDLREKANILTYENQKEEKHSLSLGEKISRYKNLKNIIEELNREFDTEKISDKLAQICFFAISRNKGTCLLYLAENHEKLSLSLLHAKKEDKHLVIKAKEGDIFDAWVLRHLSPLFIEDIRKDFRFNLEKMPRDYSRGISSLASTPLLSSGRLFGVLRLDNPQTGFFSQDDLRYLVTISDLAAVALENSRLFQKTKDLAIHDGLTGLYTKGYFLERLRDEYKRSIRQQAAFSLLMLDIDFFKIYNDQFGHTCGDLVLKALSQDTIDSLKHLSPVIGRFGGEEFCILLARTDKEQAYTIAENLRIKIANRKVLLRKEEASVTVSIGIASFPQDTRDEDGLIIQADKALYQAKAKGRNRVCCI